MLRLKKTLTDLLNYRGGGESNISKTIHPSEGFLVVVYRFDLVYNKTLFEHRLALKFLPSR